MAKDKVKKNKLVKAWVNQHLNDHYVHLAQKDGYRSRAAYKLLEIDEAHKIFDYVTRVVDLGCSPGSWSQVSTKKVGSNGLVVGVDLLPTEPINGANLIQGDFTDNQILDILVLALDGKEVDLVISDMAPNLSGIKNVDQARQSLLVELVLDFAKNYLKFGGNCVIKVFNGSEFNKLMDEARQLFNQVLVYKPNASRSKSSETYLLCKGKKNPDVV